MRLSRADRSLVAEWWFGIDRTLLFASLALAAFGMLAALAASPAAAARLGLPAFHFVERHAAFLAAGLCALFLFSFMPTRALRWAALGMLLGGVALMVAALAQGEVRNGAVRWLSIGGVSLQPSEFAKPGFVILCAWLMAEGRRRADMPALPMAAALLALYAGLLAAQPDIGQAILVALVWAALFFLAGYPLKWMGALGALMAGGLACAYFGASHVRDRIDRFLSPEVTGRSQSEIALAAFREGGWLGKGPGEGTLKMNLPDAHTDYVFAVLAEEFGIIACLFLVLLYALILWRGHAARTSDDGGYENLAASGLTLMVTSQALANMAVNVNLIPAKGVTLPFVSYGGSSVLAVAAMLGMTIGLCRHASSARLDPQPFQYGGQRGASSSGGMHI